MEISGNGNNSLRESDSFRFECRMCGCCCRDDRVIALTPQDVFNASRHLGLNSTEFLKSHCIVDWNAGLNGFALVSLRTEHGRCLFEKNNLCEIHAHRPACCRNYPIGTSVKKDGSIDHELMAPGAGCKGFQDAPELTIKEWWTQSDMHKLLPGIKLMAFGSRAISLRLTRPQQKLLFTLLYDFDAIPEFVSSEHTSFDTIAPLIKKEVETILNSAPPLRKP